MKYFDFSKNVFRDYNEDITYICEDFGFLLDGATGLFNEHYTQEKTDVVWFVKQWKEYLVEALKEDRSVFDILKDGIDVVVEKYRKISNNANIIDFPSATICLFRRINGKVEFYNLCDSPILIENRGGECIYVFDSRNMVNDNITIATTAMLAKKNKIDFVEALKRFPESLNNGRCLKNTAGHYSVLSDSHKAVDSGIYLTMDEENISKIMLLSDGYSQVFDTIGFLSKEKLIKKVSSLEDAEKIYAKLTNIQQKDKKLKKYNRFKISDDASMVFVNFENEN